MSASEDRMAIASAICAACCARAGDPCIGTPHPHRPIKGVHVARVLAFRLASQSAGWVEASEGPSGLIPSPGAVPSTEPTP